MYQNMLKKIKPTAKEQKRAQEIIQELQKKIQTKTIVGGSFAKGTNLKGAHDIDLFAPFQENENLAERLEKALKKCKNVTRLHGSRDYFQLSYKGLLFEIVPIHKITKATEAKNITDISPLHVIWVNKHATAKRKDEIRLAKQFFKAQGLYGAETHIKGFSGYVLEILTIYYGSFAGLLQAAAKWKEGTRVDYTHHYAGLNTSKKSPLVVIDPVQAERNAAAALSQEKFAKAKKAAQELLKTKNQEAFIIHKKTKKDFKKNYDLVTEIKYASGKKDVVATQALKKYENICKALVKEGFTLTATEFYPQEKSALIGISVQEKEIAKTYLAQGPPIELQEHVAIFRKKHKGKKIIEKEKRLYVECKRKYTQIEKAFSDLQKITARNLK